MSGEDIQPSLQDFSLIKTTVEKTQSEFDLYDDVAAFYWFGLDAILNIQDDEIDESITDTKYLTQKNISGHDRGIDAIYIDEESDTKATVHLFNFKYARDFEKTKGFYPASEIDKIVSFINALQQKDSELINQVNSLLAEKVQEIWILHEHQNPKYIVHICGNYYKSFEEKEKQRFEREIHKHSYFSIKYHLMIDFVSYLTQKGKIIVNGKFRGIDKYYFEKSDGDIRALITTIDALDLLRMVLDNEELRNKVDLEDPSELRKYKILEDAFQDNVRIYLKLRTKINRNIKKTALSDQNHRIFYYNNGITITCAHFEYPKTQKAPIIELTDIQIVNGSQTVHALYDALIEDYTKLKDIEILCRIYETRNKILSTQIAEYTNSQNPVSSRDIRSIDFTQQKLEQELLALGYFYERKKHQCSNKPKNKRLDAEKVGQILMALFNKLPAEAKNKKRLIFSDKYEEVFNDDLTADKILLAVSLFDKIEAKKNDIKKRLIKDGSFREFVNNQYLFHASYHILYLLGELAEIKNIQITNDHTDNIFGLYEPAISILKEIIRKEKEYLRKKKEPFNEAAFFKKNRPQKYFEDMKEKNEIIPFIEL